MPQFTGNLKTIGIEPKAGLFPQITVTATRAGVDLVTSQIVAGSRTFTPNSDGDITLSIATTLGLVPEVQAIITGRWLGSDSHFELPPIHVPEDDGTLADLLALSGISSQQYVSWGLGPPDDNWPGGTYYDGSTYPVKIYKRGGF